MRYIIKHDSPVFFEKWKATFKKRHMRKATYDDISTPEFAEDKNQLKQYLIDEQYGLCCYCCNAITAENSHIEHFRPKGTTEYSHLSMEYINLHASCQGVGNKDENCGHKKHGWFDEQLTVSPLEPECDSLFEYTKRGKIKSKGENIRAATTIKKLNLDNDILNSARETALWTAGVFEDLDDCKRQKLLELFNTPVNGKLLPFCNVIIYALSNEM